MMLSCCLALAGFGALADRPTVQVEFGLAVDSFRTAFHEPPATAPDQPDEFGRPRLDEYIDHVQAFLAKRLGEEFPFLDFEPSGAARYRLSVLLTPLPGATAAAVETGFLIRWSTAEGEEFRDAVWWNFRSVAEFGLSTRDFEQQTLDRLSDYLPSQSRALHDTLLQYVPVAHHLFVLMESTPDVFCVLRHNLDDLGLDLGTRFRFEWVRPHPILGDQHLQHRLAARAPRPGDAAPVSEEYRNGIVAKVEDDTGDFLDMQSGEIEVKVFVSTDYIKGGRRLLERRRNEP